MANQTASDTTHETGEAELKLLPCDIVMEGGITSGVVYPLAVTELAKRYQFKNIGGTSAGAIAAAATAAAELGRSKGRASFDTLNELPGWLGEKSYGADRSHLFDLFQPQQSTAALFSVAVSFLGEAPGKWRQVLWATALKFPLPFFLGFIPGLLLILLVAGARNALLVIWGILCGLALLIAVPPLAVVIRFVMLAVQVIPDNFFGLCSGLGKDQSEGSPALCNWLTRYLDGLAGKFASDGPLTFGDLWKFPTDDLQSIGATSDRFINLEMITTNLSQGRPYRLPFETSDFYFDPEEFKQFFPARVVKWMIDNAPERPVPVFQDRTLLSLPDADKMPVVVATRMSLSFPILLSAVPLYAVDWARAEVEIAERSVTDLKRTYSESSNVESPALEVLPAERCWFSDGGITINLPLQFFDAPLPRWPTFGIDLRAPRTGAELSDNQGDNVVFANDNDDEILSRWSYDDRSTGFRRIVDFATAIFHTSRTWMINTQMTAPGFRDRIAHVLVAEDEGGLKLNMPAEEIDRLSKRGQHVGRVFAERFGNPTTTETLSWANHRWIRYRTSLTLIETLITALRYGYRADPGLGQLSYEELIERGQDSIDGLRSYRWEPPSQREFAITATNELVALSDKWQQDPETFRSGTPDPVPELQSRPRV